MKGDTKSSKKMFEIAEHAIAKARRVLPRPVKAVAAEVPVTLTELPDQDLLDAGFEPDLLGLFEGEDFAERGETLLPSPPGITLFLQNIHSFVDGDWRLFAEELKVTYRHELGHCLGWDEEDLMQRELD
jgi:predicted Zn-dependent protease with MMP-like domain